MFQYLVANTDWSFVAPDAEENCCHNIYLVGIGQKLFPVPWDFDLAGLVNASYASPDPSLHTRRVVFRLYRGFCTDTAVLRGAIETVVSKQEQIPAVIRCLPMLSDRVKTERIDYILMFFQAAPDEDKIMARFEKSCLSWFARRPDSNAPEITVFEKPGPWLKRSQKAPGSNP